MITVVDVETTFIKDRTGKLDPSPFQKDNQLVSVGINDDYFCMYHKHIRIFILPKIIKSFKGYWTRLHFS